ncbi:MAG: universal stress protein [Silicimonas sp.]|nr:universal stress protein [Silicimonas sp.]
MSYKTVSTVFRSEHLDCDHLAVAISIVEQMDGHLDVLAMGTDRILPGAYFAGSAAIALQSAMSEAIEEAHNAEAAAERTLEASGIRYEVTTAVAQIGGIPQIVGRRLGMSDLIVLPKPYGEDRTAEDVAILEAAIFATRVPVLVVPAGLKSFEMPRRIVLAWNQSDEAIQAIRSAMPILMAADNVDIAIIDPPNHGPDRSDPGGLLAAMLARHGVRAEITVLARTLPRVSDVLCRHVQDRGADMVVMGAYGHSRFLEEILGGATRNMLAESAVPVIMAH